MADGAKDVEAKDKAEFEISDEEKELHLTEGTAGLLRRDYETLNKVISIGHDFASHIDPLREILKIMLADGDNVKRVYTANKNFVLRTMIPGLMSAILNKHTLDDNVFVLCNDIFLLAIDLVLQRMTPEHLTSSDDSSMVDIVSRILNPIPYNYCRYSRTSVRRPTVNEKEIAGASELQQFALPERERDIAISAFLSYYINYFGTHGGFDKMLQCLQLSPPLPFSILKSFTRIIFKVSEHTDRKFMEPYVEQVKSTLFELFLNMSQDDLRNADKKVMSATSKLLGNILGVVSPENSAETIAHFDLNIALKCFKSPYLDKRVAGLNDIKEFLTSAARKKEYARQEELFRQYPTARAESFNFGWATTEFMISWLEENQVMDYLYGSTLHPDIISRCTEVPTFLAKQKALTQAHIDLIWKAAADQHEVVVHTIFTTLADLASVMSHEHREYVYQKIGQIPLELYNPKTINMLRAYCVECVRADKNAADLGYGLDIAWQLIQDEVKVPEEIKNMAGNFMRDLLKWQMYFDHRKPMLGRCTENLKNGKSVIKSLSLLKNILDTYHTQSHAANSIASIIEWCEKEHHMLDLFFQNLVSYKAEVHQYYTNHLRENPDSAVDWNAFTFPGHRYPHRQQIFERLQFLQFVFSRSPLSVTKDQLRIMWQCIIVSALSTEESDSLFTWLENTNVSTNSYHLPNDIIQYVMNELLPLIEMGAYSVQALRLYKSFFENVNTKASNLKVDDRTKVVTVLSYPLMGMEHLWTVALCAEDMNTGNDAILYLVHLHTNVSSNLLSTVHEQRAQCVRTCFGHLNQYKAMQNLPSRNMIILRCVTILRYFIDEFDPSGAYLTRHGYMLRGAPIEINAKPVAKQQFKVQVLSNETIAGLRKKIADTLKENVNYIRLLFNGMKLFRDNEWLWRYNIFRGSTVHVLVNPQTQRIVPALTDAMLAQAPSRVMASQEYFQQLFDLLTLDDSVGQQVWELILLLPTNQMVISMLKDTSVDTPNWARILDSHCAFKLLYSLQIVDSLQDESESVDQAERGTWRQWFIRTGGVRHLVDIAMQSDAGEPSTGPKRSECYSLLYKSINSFLLVDGETSVNLREDGDLLRECVDPKVFIEKLTAITLSLALSCKTDDPVNAYYQFVNEGDIVLNALNLLAAICNSDESLLQFFLKQESTPAWLTECLVNSIAPQIRANAANCLYRLCFTYLPAEKEGELPISLPIESAQSFFLEHMLPLMDTIKEGSSQCDHYFALLSNLLESACNAGRTAEFRGLLEKVTADIVAHPVIEVRHSYIQDKQLTGLMGIARTLCHADADLKTWAGSPNGGNLVAEVLENCLFKIATADDHGPLCPPKCKTPQSRIEAYNLLEELAHENAINHEMLSSVLLQHHTMTDPEDQKQALSHGWRYNPAGLSKASCGYVGLKNQGATCYLNSLMQQFFMIPDFRRGILSLHDEIPENQHGPTFFQLQSIFANLQESEKQYYDTIPFCQSFKDHDGQPINVKVQMDVDEFFNMLLDRLETALKGSKREKILSDFFGGRLSNQIISKECEHVSEREETYYTISLAVKGKKTLQESLDLYVEGDMLAGDNKYMCGSCEKKVDALKRCCISTLPNTLIIHLRRFDFDVELLKRVKVNDQLDFPMNLNMEPYTKEGLDRIEAEEQGNPTPDPVHSASYYEYELTGILVHMGTAESGHYYSFIKEREPRYEGAARHWYQFNDQNVEYFDERDIPSQCFGGVEMAQRWSNAAQRETTSWQEKSHNAYMLFYDRVEKQQELEYSTHGVLEQSHHLIAPEIYEQVWADNTRFLKDCNLFDHDYFYFVWKAVKQNASSEEVTYGTPLDTTSPSFRAIELGTRFLLETLSRARDSHALFDDCVKDLMEMYSKHIPACLWLLELVLSNDTALENLLLRCSKPPTREGVAKLLSNAIKLVAQHERHLFFVPLEGEPRNHILTEDDFDATKVTAIVNIEEFKNPIGESSALSIRFMDKLFTLLPAAKKYWRDFSQFFIIFAEFAANGPQERLYLTSRRAFAHLTHFYLQKDSIVCPSNDPLANASQMGDKFKVPEVDFLVSFFSTMVRGTPCSNNEHKSPMALTPCEQLDALDCRIMYYDRLYYRLMEDGLNSAAVSKMVCHLAWENEAFSTLIIQKIGKGLDLLGKKKYPSFFVVLDDLIGLDDQFKDMRLQNILEELITVVGHNLMHASTTALIIKYLRELESPFVQEWLLNNNSKWLKQWLFASYEPIRDATRLLIHSFIPELRTPKRVGNGPLPKPVDPDAPLSEESLATLSRIYDILLPMLADARNFVAKDSRSEISKTRNTGMMHQSHSDVIPPSATGGYRLPAFFRLLQWCIRSREDKLVFFEESNFHAFWALFVDIDGKKYEMDPQKIEAMNLWWHAMEDVPEIIPSLTANSDINVRIMDHYICLRPAKTEMYYNSTAIPCFYRIIRKLTEHDPAFLKKCTDHRNFNWAVVNVLLSKDYPTGVPYVESIFNDACEKYSAFRQKFIPNVLKRPKSANLSWSSLLTTLETLVQTPEDLDVFCRHNGVQTLCQVPDLIQCNLSTQKSANTVKLTVSFLARASQWYIEHEAERPVQGTAGGSKSLATVLGLVCAITENSFDDEMLIPLYSACLNFSIIDADCASEAVVHFLQNHRKYLYAAFRISSNSDSDINSALIRAPLKVHSSRGTSNNHDVIYYEFILSLLKASFEDHPYCRIRFGEAIDLLLLCAFETTDLPALNPRFLKLVHQVWAAPAPVSKLLSSNRNLHRVISKILSQHQHCLADPASLAFFVAAFEHVRSGYSNQEINQMMKLIATSLEDPAEMISSISDAFSDDSNIDELIGPSLITAHQRLQAATIVCTDPSLAQEFVYLSDDSLEMLQKASVKIDTGSLSESSSSALAGIRSLCSRFLDTDR